MHSDEGAVLEEWVLLFATVDINFMKSCNITKLHIFTVLVLLSFFVGTLWCLRITLCGMFC